MTSYPAVRSFGENESGIWEALVAQAINGTFLHTRRFLGYHGARFIDRSVLLEVEGKIAGALPAAITSPADTQMSSHPGATFGGLILDPSFALDLRVGL